MKFLTGIFGASIVIWFAVMCVPQAAFAESPSDCYQQMLTKLRSVKTYQVTIEDSTKLQPTVAGSKPRTIQSTDEVAFQKPKLFSLKNDGLMGGGTVVSDGKLEYFYSELTDQYASRNAPNDIVTGVTGGLQGKRVIWMSASATVLSGVPVKKLDGVMNGARGATHVTLYIRASDSLPFQLRLVLPTISSADGDGLQITRTEFFMNQRLNAPVPHSTFQFTPPDGAVKVNSPSELSSGLSGGGLG